MKRRTVLASTLSRFAISEMRIISAMEWLLIGRLADGAQAASISLFHHS
jgi:hypothetical protein